MSQVPEFWNWLFSAFSNLLQKWGTVWGSVWWLVIIEWCMWQELWGKDSVQLSAFLSAIFLFPWCLSLLIPSVLYVRQFPEAVNVSLQLSVTSARHFPSPFSFLLYTWASCFVMFSLFSKDAAIKDIFPKKGQLSVSINVFYLKGTMKHHYLPPQRSWRNSQATYQRGLKMWFQLTLRKPLLKRFVMKIIILLHEKRIYRSGSWGRIQKENAWNYFTFLVSDVCVLST